MAVYGNFDIIFDHFGRVSQFHPTPHALWAVFYLLLAVFYLVSTLTSC